MTSPKSHFIGYHPTWLEMNNSVSSLNSKYEIFFGKIKMEVVAHGLISSTGEAEGRRIVNLRPALST